MFDVSKERKNFFFKGRANQVDKASQPRRAETSRVKFLPSFDAKFVIIWHSWPVRKISNERERNLVIFTECINSDIRMTVKKYPSLAAAQLW